MNPGNVIYQSRQQASDPMYNLTYVESNGRAVIKMDNKANGTNDASEFGRASIRMRSTNTIYPNGSLILMDAVHLPFGVTLYSLTNSYV
jgi:hypothetical protein